MAHVVDQSKCEGCGACVGACPTEAISMADNKASISDACVDCGGCVDSCPSGAISPG